MFYGMKEIPGRKPKANPARKVELWIRLDPGTFRTIRELAELRFMSPESYVNDIINRIFGGV